MAILYGTTADGESLPVQVNEFGQLVAQGVPGEQGIQGPPGPPGPVGNVELTTGTFTPTFGSSDPSGAGFIEYDRQRGSWVRYGDLLTIYVYVRTSSVTLTSIRGALRVLGLPPEAQLSTAILSSSIGPYSLSVLDLDSRGRALGGSISYDPSVQGFAFQAAYSNGWVTPQYSDLSSQDGGPNAVQFTFNGVAADAVRSVPSSLDELM